MLNDNLLVIQADLVRGIGELRMEGEFVAETRYEPERVLREWVEQGVRRAIVHCDKVRRIDSAGSSVLLGALHRFRRLGGDLILVRLNLDLNEFFEVTSMRQYFKIFETPEEARHYCASAVERAVPKAVVKKKRGRRPAAAKES